MWRFGVGMAGVALVWLVFTAGLGLIAIFFAGWGVAYLAVDGFRDSFTSRFGATILLIAMVPAVVWAVTTGLLVRWLRGEWVKRGAR